MMQFVCALTCMQELGHLKDWELGFNTKLNSPRAKPIFLSLIQTLSTHWTQDSPDVLPSAWLFPPLGTEGKITGSVSLDILAVIGCCVAKDEQTKALRMPPGCLALR